MDKREEDILDEILGEDETGEEEVEVAEEMNEIEETNEPEEVVIPETLKGEQDDEIQSEPEDLNPELDKELSQFTDDDDTADNNQGGREEIEREIREKIAQEKKKNMNLLVRIVAVCLAAVLVVGAGLFVFWMIGNSGNNYIMKFDDKKVSMEELKLTILLNILYQSESYDYTQTAIDQLTYYMLLDKAAKERNIDFSESDKSEIKETIETIKTVYFVDITIPKVSDERFEFILGYMMSDSVYTQLLETVAAEVNYSFDEAEYLSELEEYRATDKLLKYVITETEEEAQEAYDILISGAMSVDDVIRQYSVYYYEPYGIEKIDLTQIGFPEEDYNSIMALGDSEISSVIDLTGIYGVFITATKTETEEWIREYCENYGKYQIFQEEYDYWMSETKVEINEKAREKFDFEEYWASLFPDEYDEYAE